MEVCILKSDSIFMDEKVDEIILPTTTGYIGILEEHAPLVSALDNGVLIVRQGTEWKILALLGGFALIKENKVIILVKDIENAADIDPETAQKELEAAKTEMTKADISRKEYIEAQLKFYREQAKVETHKMWQNSAGGKPVFMG